MKEADAKLALYLRYQTTHERAFRQLSDELRKLRNEKRKQQSGFESQQLRGAQELRQQEMHEARLRLVNSHAIHNKIEHFRKTKLSASAADQVNRELKATQAA